MDAQSDESLNLAASLGILGKAIAEVPQEVVQIAEQLDAELARKVIDHATVRVTNTRPELWPRQLRRPLAPAQRLETHSLRSRTRR